MLFLEISKRVNTLRLKSLFTKRGSHDLQTLETYSQTSLS